LDLLAAATDEINSSPWSTRIDDVNKPESDAHLQLRLALDHHGLQFLYRTRLMMPPNALKACWWHAISGSTLMSMKYSTKLTRLKPGVA
jgi:hypothetical protein